MVAFSSSLVLYLSDFIGCLPAGAKLNHRCDCAIGADVFQRENVRSLCCIVRGCTVLYDARRVVDCIVLYSIVQYSKYSVV